MSLSISAMVEIGNILGLAFLPVSLLLFLNAFGVTSIDTVIGIQVLLIGAIGVIIVEIGDVIDAHVKKNKIILSWIVCAVLCWPGILFIISKIITMPEAINSAMPLIIPSFLFVEGLSSFFIGSS